MKLIFAQGNPGKQYERTRHNVGFFIVDTIVASHGGSWRQESKFNAEIATVHIDGERVLFVKPLSFYNTTGLVARSLVDFYKLTPSGDVLVVHDELALPFGTVRVREKGSDAGNNGIKSLNAHLGPDYWRIRVGVWNELRDKIDDADFVLSAFTQNEKETLSSLTGTIIEPLVRRFIGGMLESSSQSATNAKPATDS